MVAKEIRSVGIVGAGTMGSGIAQVCASSGYDTLLYDANTELAGRALAAIEKNLTEEVAKGRMSSTESEAAQGRLKAVSSIDSVKADLIIEAVVEKVSVKQELFVQLERVNHGKTILASNTSSLSITQIAAAVSHPSNCIGLHFFNPAHRMMLVEVIGGAKTAPALLQRMKDFVLSLHKTPVLAKDSPGFIVNRVARHYYVEALKLLEDQVASVETIDGLLQASGFRMGPFRLMDLIGVDVNFSVTASMYEAFHQDPKFRPSRIQAQKVSAGELGKKTGKGFYDY